MFHELQLQNFIYNPFAFRFANIRTAAASDSTKIYSSQGTLNKYIMLCCQRYHLWIHIVFSATYCGIFEIIQNLVTLFWLTNFKFDTLKAKKRENPESKTTKNEPDWKTSVIRNLRSTREQRTILNEEDSRFMIWCKKQRDNDIDSCFLSSWAHFSVAVVIFLFHFCCSFSRFSTLVAQARR